MSININNLFKYISSFTTRPNALKIIGSRSFDFIQNAHDYDILWFLPGMDHEEAFQLVQKITKQLKEIYPNENIMLAPSVTQHREFNPWTIKYQGEEIDCPSPFVYDRFLETPFMLNHGVDPSWLCISLPLEERRLKVIQSLYFWVSDDMDIEHLSKTKRLWNILVSLYYLDHNCNWDFTEEEKCNINLAHDYAQHHTDKYHELCHWAKKRVYYYLDQIKDL